jgi:hypothetical protein
MSEDRVLEYGVLGVLLLLSTEYSVLRSNILLRVYAYSPVLSGTKLLSHCHGMC